MMKTFFNKKCLNKISKFTIQICSQKSNITFCNRSVSNYANMRKSMDFSPELKLARSMYPSIVKEILDEQLIYHKNNPELRTQYSFLMDYTVNTDDKYMAIQALTLRSYKYLEKPSLLTEENLKKACILGWCFRFQASGLAVYDDLIDNSDIRFDKPSWFKLPDVGLNGAITDSIFLEYSAMFLIINHLGSHPQLNNIYREVVKNYATASMTVPLENECDNLNKLEKYDNMVKAYALTIPVVCSSMYLANIVDPRLHSRAKEVLIKIAELLKVEDDVEGYYKTLGKDCSDVQQRKPTWMAMEVKKRGTEKHKEIFEENWGKGDKRSVKEIDRLFEDLDMKGLFAQYKEEFYEATFKQIQELPKELPGQLFLDMLDTVVLGLYRV